MPRSKASPLKCVPSLNGQSKIWVLLMKKDVLSIDEGNTPDIVKLRHPRSGLGAMFLFSSDNSIVQEVFSFSDKRSWFINDSVRENGKLHISTPVDPSFLILPYLKKSKSEGKVVPVEDLLIDSTFPETYRLLKSSALKNMHLLADRKGPEDLNAWMYNEDKTMKWLCRKTEKVAKVLKEKQINVRDSATSKNFIKVNMNDAEDEELHLKYAHGLVSEYLTDDLSLSLRKTLGLPEEEPEKPAASVKRKLLEDSNSVNADKKMKVDENNATPSKSVKPKAISAKEKANLKAASGTKSITSFFKKK